LRNDARTALAWLAGAIDDARLAEDGSQLMEALAAASIASDLAGDSVAAGRFITQAEGVAPRSDHYPATIALVQARVIHAFLAGELNAAEQSAMEGLRLSREIGDLYYNEQMLLNLGLVAVARGDWSQSRRRTLEALRIATDINDRPGQVTLMRLLAGHAGVTGQGHMAARLLGAAHALGSPSGGVTGLVEAQLEGARVSAIAALGTARYDAEYTRGRGLSRAMALQMALGKPDAVAVPTPAVNAGPLAKRELEVATLIGDGLTNRQIGERLFISERTVTTHVGNILNKLGFDSRVQIASWLGATES
jgi:DNA-binding CsgD family transcriptional regulator